MLKWIGKTMAGVSLVTLVAEAMVFNVALIKTICEKLPSAISKTETEETEAE